MENNRRSSSWFDYMQRESSGLQGGRCAWMVEVEMVHLQQNSHLRSIAFWDRLPDPKLHASC
jgi:hypothetical protein